MRLMIAKKISDAVDAQRRAKKSGKAKGGRPPGVGIRTWAEADLHGIRMQLKTLYQDFRRGKINREDSRTALAILSEMVNAHREEAEIAMVRAGIAKMAHDAGASMPGLPGSTAPVGPYAGWAILSGAAPVVDAIGQMVAGSAPAPAEARNEPGGQQS